MKVILKLITGLFCFFDNKGQVSTKNTNKNYKIEKGEKNEN